MIHCLSIPRLYLDVGSESGGEGLGSVIVVEAEGGVHADVAVPLVDVVEGQETGAHEARAGQKVLRVGLDLYGNKVVISKPAN